MDGSVVSRIPASPASLMAARNRVHRSIRSTTVNLASEDVARERFELILKEVVRVVVSRFLISKRCFQGGDHALNGCCIMGQTHLTKLHFSGLTMHRVFAPRDVELSAEDARIEPVEPH